MLNTATIAFQFATVVWADIRQIAGVSDNLVRDWRKRDYFGEEMVGPAGWTLFGLSYLAVVNAVTKHGLGPRRCAKALRVAARDVMLHALSEPDAWETKEAWQAWSLVIGQNRPSARFLTLDGAGGLATINDTGDALPPGAAVATVVDLAAIGALLRARRPRGLARLDPGPPPAGPRVRFEPLAA